MFLLSVSRLFFCATLLVAVSANAKTVSVEGSYLLPETLSKAACYQKALMQAKQKAVMEVVGELLSSETLEFCEESEEETSCRLFQQTLNWFDGGYITDLEYDRSQNEIRTSNGIDECVVKITADVKKFKSEPDPNFALSAKIEGPRRKRDGEVIIITGETTKPAYLSLLGWYPELDENNFYKIVPNEFELSKKTVGDFKFPSNEAKRSYELFANWDDVYQKKRVNEASEVMLLLATKKAFDLNREESSQSFYKRLDALGRENWKIVKLTYFVMGND